MISYFHLHGSPKVPGFEPGKHEATQRNTRYNAGACLARPPHDLLSISLTATHPDLDD
jgi:hypothetical protein